LASLHPAARILLWCGWAVAVELADLPQLLLLAVASATAFVFPPVRRETVRLLRRTRWLLLVLVAAHAWALPGAALWPQLDGFSPTAEGLQHGALRAGRLVLMIVGLALLLALTSRPRLIYGLYVLAAPLARLGFDRRAFAVRLGLTLDCVDQAPPGTRWLELLRDPERCAAAPASYRLEATPWHWPDSLVMLAAGGLLLTLTCA